MQAILKQNKFLRFLFVSSFSYLALYLFYQFYIKTHTFIDQEFIRVIINSADAILHLLGYRTFKILRDTDFQSIGIDGSLGVWVGGGCNAITLFFLFAVFILAYPGHQKSKWWFIPMGVLTIHLLNILRVVALALIKLYKPEYLDFNHTYTFTFIVYCYIFLLWMWWVNKFSNRNNTAGQHEK
jgi:exosortase family protein XrtF